MLRFAPFAGLNVAPRGTGLAAVLALSLTLFGAVPASAQGAPMATLSQDPLTLAPGGNVLVPPDPASEVEVKISETPSKTTPTLVTLAAELQIPRPDEAMVFTWFADGVELTSRESTGRTLSVRSPNGTTAYTVRVLDVSSQAIGVSPPVMPRAQQAVPAVSITGTPRVGETLRVSPDATAPGSWAPGTSLAYQWLRNGVPLSGQTGTSAVVTGADLTSQLSVRIIATHPNYHDTPLTTQPTASVTPGVIPAGTPTVSGAAVLGKTLTGKPGSWGAGTTLSYQWLRNGAVIASATKNTYTITTADVASKLSFRVTGKRSNYSSAVTTSAPTGPVLRVLSTATPQITGTLSSGKQLTATPGTWTTGTTFTYQWFVNGVEMPWATESTYVLEPWDGGQRISVAVTGSRSGYAQATKMSTTRTVLKNLSAPRPEVTGTPATGATLKARVGTWTTGTQLSYQWKRNGSVIPGAKGLSYKLTSADAGKFVTITVTGKKAGYTTAAAVSPMLWTQLRFTASPTPTITGTPKVGAKLQAKAGSWSPSATLSYSWKRNGVTIPGATGSTYTLKAADAGKRITVTTQGKRNAYTAEWRTSPQTAVVKK